MKFPRKPSHRKTIPMIETALAVIGLATVVFLAISYWLPKKGN